MANKKSNDEAVKTMQLPRWSLPLLYQLLNIPLHGVQLRARNQFAKLVRAELAADEDTRIEMLERAADKDPKTKKPMTLEDGSEYKTQPENLKKYQKEFDDHMKTLWIIDLLPSVKPNLVAIRPLILESKMPLSTVDGYAYEELATAFEAL